MDRFTKCVTKVVENRAQCHRSPSYYVDEFCVTFYMETLHKIRLELKICPETSLDKS